MGPHLGARVVGPPHDALPLTPNGKVDRRTLPEPAADTDSVPPAGPDEEALARLWQDVLGCDRVGRGDDFFARGGTSLTATVLTSRIERDLGRAPPPPPRRPPPPPD
ncbi:phosphopantetheine-binding protein, partial [Streptomyces prasinus]|uniref:phosphopantetheine-binding protein n=1 Tax=Streptomyces prasinus TaxID=67345 RepID=UPI0036B44A65